MDFTCQEKDAPGGRALSHAIPLLGPSSQRLRAKDIEPMTPLLPLGHCDSEQDAADALSASARTRACPCKSGHAQFASCTRAATWLFPPRRPGAMGDLRGQECAPHARLWTARVSFMRPGLLALMLDPSVRAFCGDRTLGVRSGEGGYLIGFESKVPCFVWLGWLGEGDILPHCCCHCQIRLYGVTTILWQAVNRCSLLLFSSFGFAKKNIWM